MCGTAWATMTYVLMSVYVWRQHATHRLHFGLLPVLGCVGWLAAYLAAWRAAVQMALVEYAQLPTERPGCYICTAAARGHNWLVRHWSVPLSAGGRLLVNRQMQWLKAGEIALRAVPRGARRLPSVLRSVGSAPRSWPARSLDRRPGLYCAEAGGMDRAPRTGRATSRLPAGRYPVPRSAAGGQLAGGARLHHHDGQGSCRTMILLTVDELTKHFGPEPVLEGVTLELHEATKWGWSVPTVRANRRCCGSLPGSLSQTAAPSACTARPTWATWSSNRCSGQARPCGMWRSPPWHT